MNANPANANMTGTHITPPPDFPVSWPQPEFGSFHWTRDREHMPDPITPMFNSAAAVMAIASRARVVPVYDEAIVVRRDIPINHYLYTTLSPFTGSESELAERARRNREKVSAVALRLAEVWEREWEPEFAAIWAFWQNFDLENADLNALRAHFEESLVHGARLYELHYLMGSPMWFAIDEFETFYCDLFPGKSQLDAHRLLQGFDNKTLEIGRALWALSRRAQAEPTVAHIITSRPATEVWAALAAAPAGQEFLTALRAFLRAYGGRSNLWDWGYPSWEDNPTPVINNLKNYLGQPDRDLLAELAQAAAEREAAIAAARQALRDYPGPVRETFEKLLKAAQTALVLTENHTYYIDFNGFGWIHRVVHEFGKRFAAQGRLQQADDIFYLEVQELREMAADAARNYRQLAAQRRAECAYWALCDEPRELGTRPDAPLYLYSPDARRMLRYIGGFAAADPTAAARNVEAEPGVLHGQGGSPGKVRGRARVILSLEEAHRLKPGDILVTTTTAPPWTPLFLTAAAGVTDAGGLLSHGAVVSRDYRIPAVGGTRRATAAIADGQHIEVDGNAGTVRILGD